MSYVARNLMPGESVVYRATLHWILYAGPVALAALGLLLAVVLAAFGAAPIGAIAGGAFVLVAVVAGFSRWVIVKTSEFAVTNKRVIVKVGLVRRHTVELLLAKVETIGVEQTVLGRMLGYGTIIIVGTGGTREPFPNIADPLEFRKRVQLHAAG